MATTVESLLTVGRFENQISGPADASTASLNRLASAEEAGTAAGQKSAAVTRAGGTAYEQKDEVIKRATRTQERYNREILDGAALVDRVGAAERKYQASIAGVMQDLNRGLGVAEAGERIRRFGIQRDQDLQKAQAAADKIAANFGAGAAAAGDLAQASAAAAAKASNLASGYDGVARSAASATQQLRGLNAATDAASAATPRATAPVTASLPTLGGTIAGDADLARQRAGLDQLSAASAQRVAQIDQVAQAERDAAQAGREASQGAADLARAQGGVSTALGAIAGQASGATAGLNAEAQAASNAAAEHTRLNVARAAGSSTPAPARTIVADAGSDPTAAISAQRAEMGAYMASVREIQAVDARLRADILADNARVAAGTPRDDGEVARIEGVRRAYATLGAGLQALSGYQSTVTQGLIAQGQAAAAAAQEHARLNSTLNTAPAPRPDQGAVPLDPLPDAEARTALVAAYATQLDRLAARLGPLAAASYRGLFGDAWLSCELVAPAPADGTGTFVERAGAWCGAVARGAAA